MFEWLNKAESPDGKPAMAMLFAPSLVSLVATAEREKGSQLTEEEVLAVRNRAAALVLSADAVKKVEERRGYPDLDPDACWSQWQQLRSRFANLDSKAESEAAREDIRQERIKRMPEVAASPRHATGPACPKCGKPLRTTKARQCFLCGARFDASPGAAT